MVSASIVPVARRLLSLWNFLSAAVVRGPFTPSTSPNLYPSPDNRSCSSKIVIPSLASGVDGCGRGCAAVSRGGVEVVVGGASDFPSLVLLAPVVSLLDEGCPAHPVRRNAAANRIGSRLRSSLMFGLHRCGRTRMLPILHRTSHLRQVLFDGPADSNRPIAAVRSATLPAFWPSTHSRTIT
jgi:hypothetical protein